MCSMMRSVCIYTTGNEMIKMMMILQHTLHCLADPFVSPPEHYKSIDDCNRSQLAAVYIPHAVCVACIIEI